MFSCRSCYKILPVLIVKGGTPAIVPSQLLLINLSYKHWPNLYMCKSNTFPISSMGTPAIFPSQLLLINLSYKHWQIYTCLNQIPFPYHPCEIYLPTFGSFFSGKCRYIYHTWIVWVVVWNCFLVCEIVPLGLGEGAQSSGELSTRACFWNLDLGLSPLPGCQWRFFRFIGGPLLKI